MVVLVTLVFVVSVGALLLAFALLELVVLVVFVTRVCRGNVNCSCSAWVCYSTCSMGTTCICSCRWINGSNGRGCGWILPKQRLYPLPGKESQDSLWYL